MFDGAVPYSPQDPQEIRDLVGALNSSTQKGPTAKKSGFFCRKHTFLIGASNRKPVDSWRFNDWDYKKPNLPTYARGLFTADNAKGITEIVTRGYDKFFNIGETSSTEWRNIEQNTKGPYELSVKENGCIIFISGLEDDVLLVCSKHSTGARDDTDLSHAVAGEKWVDKHLESVGKSRRDLARRLREMNATAVAELCDDSFEEHVLAYDESIAGLYLHGINLNLPQFATYPGPMVQRFADEWGFKRTQFIMKHDITEVRSFLEEVSKTGSYEGKDTEGFVVRCQARDEPTGSWHDWFFKYKFEEPYLMYRQWREVTKAIIAGKSPKFKKHEKITEEYIHYARRRLAEDSTLAKAYNQNHGIIAMREGFLKEKNMRGDEIIRQELADGNDSKKYSRDFVLVPAATIGCGKTTVAVALVKLFGWGHVQNDNIQGGKNRPQRFAQQLCEQLAEHPAVIADRNNHQKRERKQIIDDVSRVIPTAHFIALHYVHYGLDVSREDIRKTMRGRVLSRGDNHQTIQAGSKSQDEIIGIMEGFLKRFEPIDGENEPDYSFDQIIDLDPISSSRDNLEKVVHELHEHYPKLVPTLPSTTDLDLAIEAAMNDYRPELKHNLDFSRDKHKNTNKGSTGAFQDRQQPQLTNGKPKQLKFEYFCVQLPATRLAAILDAVFRDRDPTTAQFYRTLQTNRRVQPAFHVTLIHRASSAQHPDVWAKYTERYHTAKQAHKGTGDINLAVCRVQLERVVWDSRIMAIVVRLLDAEEKDWNTVNAVAHVTVGTRGPEVKPKESNDLLQKWLEVGTGGESGIAEVEVPGRVVLDGNVRAVMSR